MSEANNTEDKKVETTTQPTSIFGSSFTNSTTGTGFGSVTATTTPATETTTENAGDDEHAPEYEPNVEFTPKLDLQQVDVKTNEEDEDILFEMRAKLFRYVTDPKPQWNERGTGNVKFLKHKETKKIRIVMRREKVFKVCLNHFISPILSLEPSGTSDKSWIWKCPKDYSDDEFPEGVEELFAIRFGSAANANTFKEEFEKCQKEMEELLIKKDDEKKED